MISSVTDLLFILVAFILASAVGLKMLKAVGVPPLNFLGQIALGAGLGLGVFAYATFFLGWAGWLYPWVFWLLFLLTAILCQKELKTLGREGLSFMKTLRFGLKGFEGVTVVLFAAAFLAILIGALGPDLGNDSLCYHMEDPKVFIRNHRIGYLPYSENSLFPYLMEMLFLIGLLLKGAVAAKLFHFLTGFLAFLAVISWGQKFLRPFYAFVAGALFLLTPGIHNQMGTAYIDVGLAFYTLLSYYTLSLWIEKREEKWLVLSGIFTGLAFSVKYQAMFSLAVISFLIFCEVLLKKGFEWKKLARSYTIFISLVFVFSFIWYLRSYLHTGTPIYPYFTTHYGGEAYHLDLERNGMGKGLWNYLLLFWNFTMYPEVFGGSGNQFGIAFLIFLPFLIAIKRTRPIHFILLAAFLHITVWFSFRHNLRYLFSAVPLLSLLVASVLQDFLERNDPILRFATRGILLFAVMLNTGMVFYHQKEVYRVPLGLEPAGKYLARTERSFEIAQAVNRLVPESEKILNAEEIRAFYFKPRMIREKIYRRMSRYPEISKDGAEVASFLKKEGFHYLLISRQQGFPDHTADKERLGIRNLVKNPRFAKRYLTPLHSAAFRDPETNLSTEYSLFQFK